ncbi:AraC family transcriptional regulator [Oceanobacillus arenosus]|uniref:AraC family transcriptional regulator n=1 Tax=Oceanobacillus arenosus TaxID=1229153 RepID=A0A3D8Q1H6_9BACI|nr:helix-turn-helix domain-containing protein [Oceanobacillus arenosus]RDW21882.1 AraC family transcriptional regulator [Oceanobacillus arenosus]
MKGMVYLDETLLINYRVHGKWADMGDYHSHQEYEIYFFHGGSCRYLIRNQIYDLEPGDILLMDGMTLHKPNVPQNSEYVRSTIHFSPQWIQGMLQEIGGMHLLDVFKKLHHCLIRTKENEESKALEKVIQRMSDVKRSSNSFAELEMKALLLQVLIMVNQLGQVDSMKLQSSKIDKMKHAEDIVSFIQTNYMYKLTIDSISDALSLSKSYVSHVFKEMTGFTVMEYVMGYRLTQVKFLLEMEPDKALKDIANECGFESVSHFSRYFREKVGVTAREYRSKRLKIY